MAELITGRVTRTPGVCGGKACISGHRVRVMDIVILHEHVGLSADEIVSQLPSITLSDVYAALAYYFDHRDEIQEDIRGNQEVAQQLLSRYPSKLKQKLSSGQD